VANPQGTYIALLRGVNVGRANRVAMADLRRLLGELGFTSVRTLLNSGNALFETDAAGAIDAAARIEAAIASDLGAVARVVVVSAADLERAVSDNPLTPVSEPSRFVVAFLAPDADASRLRGMEGRDWSPEAFALVGRVAYLSCVNGIADSPVAAALAQALGATVTSRNWATVLRLHEMASA
jgi:uncharacterized protein (DUF1697 family)